MHSGKKKKLSDYKKGTFIEVNNETMTDVLHQV